MESFDENDIFIQLSAESSSEADALERLFKNGVRVAGGNRWNIVITDPRLANLTALYLNNKELQMLHNAIAEYHIKDKSLSSLLKKVYPDSVNQT